MIPDDKLHVAVDLDDVVLDFGGGIERAIKKECGVDVRIETWDLHALLDPILGQSWWDWLRERDWLWSGFPAVDGAINSVTRLRREGHYVELVTSKPMWAEYVVWQWLGKWRVPFHRVTLTDMEQSKVEVTDADVLIDDKPANASGFAHDGRLGLLFDRPHNQSYETSEDGVVRLYRARGWSSALDLVRLEQDGLL